ncbi:protein suppressor of white apricot [Rhopalosiphum maidis]|uniref:protein suppressor of white apricot n=1 Tax=Rhopalosiphum maidis TaxID=43146 RepID=UPI000EFF4315|nr:protein suppressor of white apricot [Rhopalosiphum maidis]
MSYINAYKNRSTNNGTSEDEKQTLLVFGYSCKLFKDDEKALFIDQGKHLIPWMGDDTLKIDRYDCRGALSDLKSVEALPFGQSRWEGLTADEKKIEQLCDEERYKSLNDKSEEESIYQEEELKRLHQALNNDEKEYGQVGYKYEDESSNTSELKTADDTDYDPELEEAFIPPRELEIPSNMHVPPTKKLNAIIEKTALFISKHGAQMEVLLKAKQAHNPQFEFLSYDRPLYPYYQHVLSAIRSCRYNPTLANDSAEDSLDSSNEESYLHPSLLKSAKQPETTPFIPNITYKPSADCSYSLLVNKIKEKQSAMPVEETIINEVETPPITVTTSEFDGLTKSARRRLKKKLVSQSTLNAPNSPDTDDNEIIDELSSVEATANTKTEAEISNPVQQNVTVGIDVPPNDLQIIIDKMASYVTKNGKQFEETARKRQDPRLKFLEPDDCFNAYYTQKLKLYATIKRLEQTAPLKLNMDSKTNSKLPVCFSLKKQKESESVEIKKSALEDSSNETSDDEHKKDRIDKTELNHIKLNKSSTSVKKNPLQNTAKLAEERLKDKLAMAAKEKLSMLERERTKKEKEKIQAERKRKAAQFLASMKIISSSKNSNTIKPSEKSDTQILDSPVHNSVVNTVDQKTSTDEKNGLPDVEVKDSNIQPPSSKVQDIISIGSSDEDISNDGHLNKNINGNRSSKLSLQSRLQETLSKDNKRKKIERYEKEKDNYKRIKHYDENKEKTPDHRYSSRDRDRNSRRSKKSHSSHHSSSKDHKKERGSKRSKHKHKSKKSKKHTRNHNSDSSDDSSNTNNSHFS